MSKYIDSAAEKVIDVIAHEIPGVIAKFYLTMLEKGYLLSIEKTELELFHPKFGSTLVDKFLLYKDGGFTWMGEKIKTLEYKNIINNWSENKKVYGNIEIKSYDNMNLIITDNGEELNFKSCGFEFIKWSGDPMNPNFDRSQKVKIINDVNEDLRHLRFHQSCDSQGYVSHRIQITKNTKIEKKEEYKKYVLYTMGKKHSDFVDDVSNIINLSITMLSKKLEKDTWQHFSQSIGYSKKHLDDYTLVVYHDVADDLVSKIAEICDNNLEFIKQFKGNGGQMLSNYYYVGTTKKILGIDYKDKVTTLSPMLSIFSKSP